MKTIIIYGLAGIAFLCLFGSFVVMDMQWLIDENKAGERALICIISLCFGLGNWIYKEHNRPKNEF